MAWFYLFLAGLCEIIWAVGLKYTDGFTKLYPSIITLIGMLASFLLLAYALKSLPLGTAYAVWTGIGAIGTALYGIYFFNESTDFLRMACITLIVIAILGLKFSQTP